MGEDSIFGYIVGYLLSAKEGLADIDIVGKDEGEKVGTLDGCKEVRNDGRKEGLSVGYILG